MDRLLADTNIVLDLLTRREGFYEEASILFSLADNDKVELFVSSLTFAHTYYILTRHTSDKEARKALRKLKVLVSVLPMDDKVIDLALNSDFNDFEDAVEYYTAIENNLQCIITRNLKAFKLSKLPVMRASDYLAR
jgi:predicted nucleic acid-binding protein